MQVRNLLTLAICCLASFSLSAQYGRNFDSYDAGRKARLKRYYVGYGIPAFMKLKVTTQYMADGDGGGPVNVSRKFTLDGVTGYGAQEGTFYILSRAGRQNAMCLDVAVSEFYYFYKTGPMAYGSNTTLTDESVVGIFCVPIGISYKSGGEVSLNKYDKSTLSIGMGVAPAMSIAKVFAADARLTMRGYLAAEIGVFAGIEWKLRATYFTSGATLINVVDAPLDDVTSYDSSSPLGVMNVKAVASGDFNLALVILPFSFRWDKEMVF